MILNLPTGDTIVVNKIYINELLNDANQPWYIISNAVSKSSSTYNGPGNDPGWTTHVTSTSYFASK